MTETDRIDYRLSMAKSTTSKDEFVASIVDGSTSTLLEGMDYSACEDAGVILADLHNDRTFDVIGFLLDLDWSEASVVLKLRIEQILPTFIAGLQVTAPRMVDFLQELKVRVGAGALHQIEEGFLAWCKVNSDQLMPAVGEIQLLKDDSSLLHVILSVQIELDREAALQTALEMSVDPRPNLSRHAMLALAQLSNGGAITGDPAVARLTELVRAPAAATAMSAIHASFMLAKLAGTMPVDLVDAIGSVNTDRDPGLLSAKLSGWLYNPGTLPDFLNDRFALLIQDLTLQDSEQLGLLNTWLYNADLDGDRRQVLGTLSKVIEGAGQHATFKGLHALTYRLGQNPKLLTWYAAAWLLEGTHAVRDIVHELFTPLDDAIYPAQLDMLELSEHDYLFVARKVFAYLLYSHGPAVSLLSGLLQATPKEARRRLENEIADFWLRNFPNDIGVFESAATLHPEYGLAPSIKRLRKLSKDYVGPLGKLPKNPALRPSALERRTQSEIAHLRSQEVRKAADEASIFASLVSKSTLLYGRSSVTYTRLSNEEKPQRQVFPLQTYQTSVTIPGMDVLAPAHLRYLLYSFRIEDRSL